MKTLLKIALFALISCQVAHAETDIEKLSRLQEEVQERVDVRILDSNNPDYFVKKLRTVFPELYKKVDKLPNRPIKQDLWFQVSLLELLLAVNDGKWSAAESILESWIERYSPKQKTVLDDKTRKQPDSQLETKSAGTLDPFTLVLPGGTKMEFMPIPAGTFVMGSPEDEDGRDSDENQVRVNITKAFYMGKTEVTEAQFLEFFDDDSPSGNKNNEPVEKVTWNEAMEYCKALTKWAHKQGKFLGWMFTLPTEAQWEYACRAGTTTMYHSGGKRRDLKRVAWYSETSKWNEHEVAQKEPNLWGLYDMHGNVWEWCSDWYARKLQGGDDPTGPESGSFRVLRGGGWLFSAQGCRSALRGGVSPGYRGNYLGFRVALVQE